MASREWIRSVKRFALARPRLVLLPATVLGILLLAAFVVSEVPLRGADQVATDPGTAGLRGLGATHLADTDNDTLPDVLENYGTGTNLSEWDTSGDGVPDGWLFEHGADPLDPNASRAWAAYPGPGQTPPVYGQGALPPVYRLTLAEAYNHSRPEGWSEARDGPNPNALDPTVWEAPSGLPIPWLVHHGLPLDQDPDAVLNETPGGFGSLTVRESYETNTDPRRGDTDRDGLLDVEELEIHGTDPAASSTSGAGIPDGWLVEHGLDLTNASIAFEDPDNDGLTNREEYQVSEALLGRRAAVAGEGLSPLEASSSGSGLPDGWTVEVGLDPLDPGIRDRVVARSRAYDLTPGGPPVPADLELPHVNLTVADAYAYDRPVWWREASDGVWWGGLDPSRNDTDSDGLPDVVELRGWYVGTREATGNETTWIRVDADPRKADTDGEGLSDREEFEGAIEGGPGGEFAPTDPRKPDSDFDGLDDRSEVTALQDGGRAAAGGLDPMDPDTDDDGLHDGREWDVWQARRTRYAATTSYEFEGGHGDATDWVGNLTWARRGGSVPAGSAFAALFGPGGDVDRDGLPNILDPDSDNDDLRDGWEVDPSLYRDSPFASPFPRQPTDPANPDTDGDTLPDAWEVRHGKYDPSMGGWNLDPASWSSLSNGVSDAEVDLDDDGIEWNAYRAASVGFTRETHAFEGTNHREYLYGTDPNQADTSGDGLLDGWGIFWGIIYPSLSPSEVGEVYPGGAGAVSIPAGRPIPDPTVDNDAVTTSFAYQRLSKSPTPIEAWGEDPGQPIRFTDAEGERVTQYLLRGTIPYRFSDHQEHGTNPYLDDGDGDGMLDSYELLSNIDAPAGEGLDPSRWDARGDPDGDGLSNREEAGLRTSPFRSDTDAGGVSDGQEVRVGGGGLDPLDGADDRSFLNLEEDRDGDGLPDARELFETGTNISRVDTDRDGLLDGSDRFIDPDTTEGREEIQALERLGVRLVSSGDQVVARGEQDAGTDPLAWDTSGDGVPDGWRDAFPSAPRAFYEHCKPAEWDEATMGPWWGGLDPTDPAHDVQEPPVDLDSDGLHDLLGEDPYPCVRPEPAPPDGIPWKPGLDPETVVEAAQAYGTHGDARNAFAQRDAGVANGVPDVQDRARTLIELTAVNGVEPGGGPVEVSKGQINHATGRLVVDERDASGRPLQPAGTPVPNATVVVNVNDPSLVAGIGFTDAQGRFNVSFGLVGERSVEIPTPGMVAMGEDEGRVTWQLDPGAVSSGRTTGGEANRLWVRSYNSSASVLPGHPTFHRWDALLVDDDGRERVVETHAVAADRSTVVPLDVIAGASVSVDAPEQASTGATIRVTVELSDGAGTPLGGQTVRVGWDDEPTHELVTAANGSARLTLPVSVPTLGAHEVTALFEGDPSTGVRGGEGSAEVFVKGSPTIDASARPQTPVGGAPITIQGALLVGPDPIENATVSISGLVQGFAVTDEAGRFTLQGVVPAGAEPGSASVRVNFPGSQRYLGTETALDVTVQGISRIPELFSGTLTRGHETVLDGRLVAGDGEALPDRLVELSLDGRRLNTTRTDSTGGFQAALTLPPHSPLGPRVLEARFPGDGAYQPSEATSYMLVRSNTTIELDALGPLVRGTQLQVDGVLRDDAGDGLAHRLLDLWVGGEHAASVVTGDAGGFRLRTDLPGSTPLGPTRVSVVFNGTVDGSLGPTAATLEARVVEATVIKLEDAGLVRGANRWTGTLEEATGTPVGNASVQLLLDGELRAFDATSPEGRFTLPFTLPHQAELGRHTVEVRFQGTPRLAPAHVSRAVLVETDASIELDAPERLLAGGTVTIGGAVQDAAGNPVRTGQIQVQVGSISDHLADVSDGSFAVSITLPRDAPLGPTNLTASYLGTPHIKPTTTSVPTRVVERVDLNIDLPADTQPGQVYEATVHLRTDEGVPVQDAPLIVRSSRASAAFVVRTSDDGTATIPVLTDQAGEFSFQVAYPGARTQAPATVDAQTLASFQVEERSWGLLASGSALLLAAGAGYILVRWWRRPVRAALSSLEDAVEAVTRIEDPRQAVLTAYQRFERILVVAGIPAAEQRTPRETLEQLRDALPVAIEPATEVASIFERTLFGEVDATREDRQRVIRALERIRNDLRTLLAQGDVSKDEGPVEVPG